MNKPKIFSARGRIITEILGRNKYSNYNQALNEAVANSLDAKSDFIEILINNNSISIIDNGKGMSENELKDRYFRLGEKNLDSEARGMFGIGVCANSALGDELIVETRLRNSLKGMRAVVDFKKVEKTDISTYEPELWEEINFDDKKYNTLIKIQQLRWPNINPEDITKYLQEKHWPLLLDQDIGIKIAINKKIIIADEPRNVEKYEFDSEKDFFIGDKIVPSQKNKLMCGKVTGIFYLKEDGFKEPSIDVYVKSQRIDAYSGDRVDWLRIKDLSSPEGFKSRIKGVIKVDATDEVDFIKRNLTDKKILQLKSDRTSFFEDAPSFSHLCLYLNGSSKVKGLNLPHGGILRLINSNWYKRRGTDISKTQELIHKLEPDLIKDISKIFEEEKLRTKKEKSGLLEKKMRKETVNKDLIKPENLMFRCSQCENIIRVKKTIYKEWEYSNKRKRIELEKKYWECDVCSHVLDPIKDKYKRGPIRGQKLMTVALDDGTITHIIADRIGRNGPRSFYIPEDSAIKINAEHSLLIYSIKTSDDAFKCNLLDSIIFAIAAKRSKDRNMSFESIYNDLSSKVNKVIDMDQYEEALTRLRVNKN